jgi:hypothetical protein
MKRVCLTWWQCTLEFELRLQEYIELARATKYFEALAYWRKHLQPWQETHLARIQQATGLIAFRTDTTCKSYRVSWHADRSLSTRPQNNSIAKTRWLTFVPYRNFTTTNDGNSWSNHSDEPSTNFIRSQQILSFTTRYTPVSRLSKYRHATTKNVTTRIVLFVMNLALARWRKKFLSATMVILLSFVGLRVRLWMRIIHLWRSRMAMCILPRWDTWFYFLYTFRVSHPLS